MMERIQAGDELSMSTDGLAENIRKLKELFPELVTEAEGGHAINVDVLKGLVGDRTVTDAQEKYGLNWFGKRQARQLALTPSLGTLRPCKDESVDWDTTKNLMIEGDNLEVLKLLQKSYAGKVKLIYIDPPYNTGHDFVYPDNFHDNIKNYHELTGQADGAGRKLSSNTEASGRFHTDWLNMMYPRLKLARDVLRDDGAIFISIGEAEVANLRALGEAIFGQECYVATFIWDGGRKNDSKRVSINHEYVLVFSKSASNIEDVSGRAWRERKLGIDAIYEVYKSGRRVEGSDWTKISKRLVDWYGSLPSDHPSRDHEHYRWCDEVGVYFASDLSGPDDGRKSRPRYEVLHPTTARPVPVPSRGWRWEQSRMRDEMAGGRVHFGPDEASIPNGKVYLHENEWQAPSSVFYKDRRAASGALKKLMGEKVFDFPKDPNIVGRFIGLLCSDGDTVLDFFAGSGTTAEAAMSMAAAQGISLRSILVQLPEPIAEDTRPYRAGFHTISDITKERLRRAGAKIRSENPLFSGDLGFRVFKLDSTNIHAWDPKPANVAAAVQQSFDHLKPDRTNDDILYEVLLKHGLDLSLPIEERVIGGKKVYSVAAGTLLACLDLKIAREEVEPLALGIVAWLKELWPLAQDLKRERLCIFRDAAFGNDNVTKSNLAAILEQNGLADVRSL